MKEGKTPNPNVVHPIKGYENEIYIKPTINNPNIIVVSSWGREYYLDLSSCTLSGYTTYEYNVIE